MLDQYGIGDNCPIIWKSNWEEHSRNGWRWISNEVSYKKGDITRKVENAQDQFGIDNVTLGHYWNKDYMRPEHDTSWVGLYVRDVESQVDGLRDWMDNQWERERI